MGPIIQQESVDVDEKLRSVQSVEEELIPIVPIEEFVISVKQKEPVNADQELQKQTAQTAETKQPATSTWRKVLPLRDYSEQAETEPASNDFSLGYRGGHRPGYHRSYSSTGLFLIPDWERHIVPFSDFRLHV